MKRLLSVPHFKDKESKKIIHHGHQDYGWISINGKKGDVVERHKGTLCRARKDTKLSTIPVPRVTRLIITRTCYAQKKPTAEPQGTSRVYATKIHLLTHTSMMPGTKVSPFEREPKSQLSLSAFQMALHMSIRNVQEALSSL